MTSVLEPTALDIYRARQRLLPHLRPTPLRASPWLSGRLGGDVALKLESLNPTHAFKVRGAFNAAIVFAGKRQAEGGVPNAGVAAVVTASAGNHGQALALAASKLGLHCTVFTPSTAPATKKQAITRAGAVLRDEAEDYDTAERLARAFAEAEGATYISPYNDADVIAGAGTIGLEIVESRPTVDIVVVPVGGGGLAAGVGLALRAAAPRARIVGVEAEASSPFAVGLASGRITTIHVRPTLADGLAGNLEAGSITFPLVQRVVDEIVTVSEDEIRDAMQQLAAEEHLIAEGAAATVAAALLSGKVSASGRVVAAVVTGGNVDIPNQPRALPLISLRRQEAG